MDYVRRGGTQMIRDRLRVSGLFNEKEPQQDGPIGFEVVEHYAARIYAQATFVLDSIPVWWSS